MANYPTSASTDANLYIQVNNTSTTLSDNPLTSGATTVNVSSASAFPTAGYITIDSEAIAYTGKTSTSFTGCTRGADGTTATSHTTGTQVYHNVVAQHHNGLKNEIEAIETDLVNLQSAITPVTATNTATSVLNRIAMLCSQIKNMGGLTNWYDSVTAMLPKTGGTLTGSLSVNNATCKISLDGTSTTNQIGSNYDLGTIANTSNTSANINLNCPVTNASVTIGTSDTANTSPSTIATFQSGANGGCQLVGTTKNDNAASGIVGERVASGQSTYQSAVSNGAYYNITSIPLTAGDWDIVGQVQFHLNGATITECFVNVSQFSGATTTDLVTGDNSLECAIPTSAYNTSGLIAGWRVNTSTSTTVYLKVQYNFSAGTPQALGRISARRIR